MVQLSPITKFGSSAGYEYENKTMYASAHTNKGHWNLCNIPILPVSGDVNPADFGSTFSHMNEAAHPGDLSGLFCVGAVRHGSIKRVRTAIQGRKNEKGPFVFLKLVFSRFWFSLASEKSAA